MANKTYKNTELTFISKKYDGKNTRHSIEFTFGDSSYKSAHILPTGAEDGDVGAVRLELEKWAELVIDEQIAEATKIAERIENEKE